MNQAISVLVNKLEGLAPKTAIVLGSGLGSLVEEISDAVHVPYADLEGFPHSGVSGHAAQVVAGNWGGTPVLFLSGRAHYYENGDPSVMRAPLETLHGLGIKRLILTNAAGSLRDDMPPGSVMQITDHINFSGTNPLFGEPSDRRFVGLTNAYDAAMRDQMQAAAERAEVELHQGVYMWFSGPSFETPAEIRMARTLGADAVGMSTVPEVILARFLGLDVAAASVVTNLAAGMSGEEISHQETKDMAPLGGKRLAAVLREMLAGH